jgi:glycyl-tRNA synthetase
MILALADRLDTLAGLFTVGLIPSGNRDPFALRRAAIGLIQTLIEWDLNVDLSLWISHAAGPVPGGNDKSDNLRKCLEFIAARMHNQFQEDGYAFDVVDAVVAAQSHNPASAKKAVQQLAAWVAKKDWPHILDTYSRCVRITRDLTEKYTVDPALFEEKAEKELFAALEKAEKTERAVGSVDDFLNAFLPMMPAVEKFFDDVLVMAEDEKVKRNRLGLLQRIAALADGVADMSRLEGF